MEEGRVMERCFWPDWDFRDGEHVCGDCGRKNCGSKGDHFWTACRKWKPKEDAHGAV